MFPTSPPPARIFISYATADGAEAATRLRTDLEARDPSLFSVWQDLVRLEGGRDWWSQIEAAIRHPVLQHLVLIVTPAVIRHSLEWKRPEIARPVIRDELRLARRLGKSVIPVRGPGLDKLAKLPRWLGQVMDLDKSEHLETVLRRLAGSSVHDPVPLMAPPPPTDFVPRKAEIEALKADLLAADSGDAVAITAALRGTTGFGKTALALALAADPDIEDAYFDGILWVVLGEKGRGHVVPLIGDIIGALGEPREDFTTPTGAADALAKALGNKRILLIIDDVWHRRDVEPFLKGGPGTTRLITTRFAQALPGETKEHRIGPMIGGTTGEAWRLLASELPEDQVATSKTALVALAERRHNWPQALRLANGYLRTRMGLSKHTRTSVSRFRADTGPAVLLADAIRTANKTLDARGSASFDPTRVHPVRDADQKYDERHERVTEAMVLNLSLITEDARQRFAELAVFPEDVDVPVGMAARLWRETGGLDRHEAEGLLEAFDDASLLLDLDPVRGTFRFHDSVREYLIDQAPRAEARDASMGMPALHRRLINAMDDIGGDKALPLAPGEQEIEPAVTEYFYRYLLHHLAAADDRQTLDALLLAPGWMMAKMEATKSPWLLIRDYEQFGGGATQKLIGRTLRLICGICARDPRQLLPQLLGRLMGRVEPDVSAFVAIARSFVKRPAMLVTHASMTPPGAEISRLEGHEDSIRTLCFLQNGQLASGSKDCTIRLWDLENGQETARIEQMHWVRSLALLSGGHIVSGSNDGIVRLLDPASSEEIATFRGHTGPVLALSILPDGRIASGSEDSTVRLWDSRIGTLIAILSGHTAPIRALTLLLDGRLASASDDGTVRLWDTTKAVEVARLSGHTRGVNALTVLADGRLVSASDDKTVRLWDPLTAKEIASFVNDAGVNALAVLPDGRLASATYRAVHLLNTATGEESVLTGHVDVVHALAALPDGRLLSCGDDRTVRLWDPGRVGETSYPAGHSSWVAALALLPDGRIASGAFDSTVRLWDPQTNAENARFVGLADRVLSLAVLPDGRVAAGTPDRSVVIWDTKSGTEAARLEEFWSPLLALAAMPDGRLATAGDDTIVRLWDLRTCTEILRLKGHAWRVQALAVLPDGRLATGAADNTVRLWNTSTGRETSRFEGHTHWIQAIVVLPNGLVASASSDKTVRLWDPGNCRQTVCLAGHDGAVRALAVGPDGLVASGSEDKTIRLWDAEGGLELCRLEVDAGVCCLITLRDGRLVAGDSMGRLHWVEVLL